MSNAIINEFLDEFDKCTENCSFNGKDRALYLLLKKYKDKLPTLDHYFHKAFRQIDVIDGTIDMVIWHLIRDSDMFWEIFTKVTDKYKSKE